MPSPRWPRRCQKGRPCSASPRASTPRRATGFPRSPSRETGRRPLRAELRRRSRGRTPRRGGDRERERGARDPAPARDQLADLPRLCQQRPDRVELCAAAKNVIALAAGGVDGLELGDNAKAALITRAAPEMSRLAAACGARPETFAGLAGMGDLMVTCWSRLGRPARGRADRAWLVPRGGSRRDRPGRGGADHRTRAASSQTGSTSSFPSPRACARY